MAKILDVIEGLQEVHRHNIVHRDVKPSNCFLEADGRVKVGDFGLSKLLTGNLQLTQPGSFLGTPLFASPEQVRAERVDQQSDVYSVAATLYFLLMGKAPFQTNDLATTLARIVSDPAPSMRTLRPDLHPGLDQVVLTGLERDPAHRWRDLADFKNALEQVLDLVSLKVGALGDVGKRFMAFLIDVIIFLLVSGLLSTIMRLVFASFPDVAAWYEKAKGWIRRFDNLLLLIGYFGLSEGIWGVSPGKALSRLRVIGARWTGPPGLARATLRAVVFFLPLSLIPAIGLAIEALLKPWDLPHSLDSSDSYLWLYVLSFFLFNALGLGLLERCYRWWGWHKVGGRMHGLVWILAFVVCLAFSWSLSIVIARIIEGRIWPSDVPSDPLSFHAWVLYCLRAFLLILGWLIGPVICFGLMLLPVIRYGAPRLLHEALSGTRVVSLPAHKKHRDFRREPLEQRVGLPEACPERLGAFVVIGALRWDEQVRIVVGEDPVLERKVWLWLRPLDEPQVSESRRQLSRHTRPRWLASGIHGGQQWDAFIETEGVSLPDLVRVEGRMSWTEARPILEKLTSELDESWREGTIPTTLEPEQTWIQSGGGVQLLDLPLSSFTAVEAAPQRSERPISDPVEEQRILSFLGRVMALALEGRPRPQGEVGPVCAPVPLHATDVLDWVCATPAEGNWRWFKLSLERTHDDSTQVHRTHRVVQFALMTFNLLFGALILISCCKAFGMTWGCIPLVVLASVITSDAFTGGSFSYELTFVCLVCANGQAASRLRCAWRSFLVWGPLVGLLLLSALLRSMYESASQPHPLADWAQSLSTVAGNLATIWLPILYAGLAILSPVRGLHDRLAGTYLVPE